MTDTTPTNPDASTSAVPVGTAPVRAFEEGQDRINQLLVGLQGAAPSPSTDTEWVDREPSNGRFENQLACVRLGMATSLFYALRTKHAPTAAHSLRVALSCSAWAERLKLDDQARDRIEVAALLHDLGKIGAPDRILRKPGRLSTDEQLVMACCPQLGCEILRGCTNDVELLDIVQYASRWYDSRRQDDGPKGDALPLGARMIAISDAFDAMTTDTVYRRAMSRERAIQELLNGCNSQFEPQLAEDFSRMLEDRPEILHGGVVNRWLRQLQPETGNAFWSANTSRIQAAPQTIDRETLFYQHLAGNIKDGVAFTDAEGTITQWNEVMCQLTGIPGSAIVGKVWSNQCVWLEEKEVSDSGSDVTHEANRNVNSLVVECLSYGSVISRTMRVVQANQESKPVHVQVSPVRGSEGGTHGTVILVRDLTEKADLTKQLKSLHQQTTQDALTGVANRAHFDSVLAKMTEDAESSADSFSLIICDIDHFKRVNDVHGHPAGDEALVSFARVLSTHSRDADLVARYGGEEFLLLAPNCDNSTASNRAEAIREALEATPLPSLRGESVTASFGVTQFQSGDTPETLLARADRALLKAKDNGRNRVIQLGSGNRAKTIRQEPKRSWFSWFDSGSAAKQGEFDIVTKAPIDLAIEKLRGFIADHAAEVITVDESQVSLKLDAFYFQGGRRRLDQKIAIRAKLTLSEQRDAGSAGALKGLTNVHVELEPIRSRDRRSRHLSTCFSRIVVSLNSYVMGEIQDFDKD